MANNKITIAALLLVFGVVLMIGVENVQNVDARFKLRASICYDDMYLDYMTCPSTGDAHLTPKCSCDEAHPGCTFYFLDGSTHQC
ncbi:hypothetical protein RND81_03G228900 [Saponaria officinalis]|uniref:Uncharacterized protein n=1 Tax=Saponaria officinalis TaxID=3572 RepID=A0AAW1MAS9_SAPOF